MGCPVKNKEYLALEERVGSTVAYSLFNKFNEDYEAINKHLDSLDKAKAAENKLGLRNKDGSRKKIDKKKFEKTHKEVIALNKSGKIPQGYRATRIEVKGEKGDNRMYDAIAIKPIEYASNDSTISTELLNTLEGKTQLTAKEALELISKNANNGSSITNLVAKRLLRLISNDVKIHVVDSEYMAKNFTRESKGLNIAADSFVPGGIYLHNENEIFIDKNRPSRILIHEILHAFTVKELKKSTENKFELNYIFKYIQAYHPEIAETYAMSNLDEFLVGVFTDPNLVKQLSNIKGINSNKLSLWDEVLDVLTKALEKLGLSPKKSRSLLEESMHYSIGVLEDAKSDSNSKEANNSDEAYDTSEFEEVYASLAPEEQAYYEAQTMSKEQEETMKTVLANQNIGLNKDGSFYVRKEGNKDKKGSIEYTRVSNRLENGFEDEGRFEINREVGNDVDSILSDVILGKSFSETASTPRIDDTVKKELYDYFTALKKKLTADGSIMMTQQIFSNDTNPTAGATDIILIKPNGSLSIYDLKTSTTSTIGDVDKGHYITNYEKGYKGQKSKKEIHIEQQSMYKRLAELQGFKVEGLHIVPINIKISKGKVVTAKPEPIIKLDYNQVLAEGLLPEVGKDAKSVAELIHPEKVAVAKIRERLSKLSAHWKNKEKGEVAGALDKLDELHDKMNTVEDLESIQEFIRDSAEIVEGFKRTMVGIRNNSTSKASIIKLGNINMFMDTFDVLVDIQRLMYRESPEGEQAAIDDWNSRRILAKALGEENEFRATNPYPGIKSTLDATVTSLRDLKQDYLQYGRSAYANLLFANISPKILEESKVLKAKLQKENPESARAAAMITSVSDMERELANASTDISGWQRFMGSAAGDENAIIALTSLMIKDKLEPVTEQLINDSAELGSILEKYLKETGKSRDDVAKLNEDIIEVSEKKVRAKDGSWETLKQKQFVDKTDWRKFSEAQSKEYKRLEEQGVDKDSKEHTAAINKWYNENTQIKPNFKDIIADRKANLTPYEFKVWTADNYPSNVPRNELREPKPEFTSEKWRKLYNDSGVPISAAGRYHQGMLKKYDEFINQLDYKDRIKLTSKGYKLPSVMKGDWERGFGQAKTILKNKVKVTAADTNYKNNQVLDVHGKEIKEIPKHFVEDMSADEVSSDVFESLLKVGKNWRYYKAKSEIQAEVQLVRDLVEAQTVDKTDSLGNAINDIKAKILKGKAKKDSNNIADKLNDHLDIIFYNSEDERSDVKIGKHVISGDKVLQNILFTSSAISLTGNIISGISNASLGNLTNVIEAGAGEYMTPKAIAKAHVRYTKSLGNMALDVNKLTGKSLETQLFHLYDFDQSYIESVGDNESGSRVKQMLGTGSLGFVNNAAEHQIASTGGFAYLESIKWIEGSFQNRKDYLGNKSGQELKDAKAKFDGTTESLLEAYELGSNGVIKLKDKYTLAQKDRSTFKNTLHELNKYNQGNYAKHDKVALQRTWYGKLALFFRKHIQPGIAKRFGRERINYALGGSTAGIYTDTAKSCIEFVKTMLKEMEAVGILEAFGTASGKLTNTQRANMKRAFAEGAALLIVIQLVSLLGGDDEDDEPKTWTENLALLQARRLQSELNFYSNPIEAFRVIKSPTVAMGTVESGLKFGYGLLDGWGGDDVYTRRTGFWEKGDNKDLARLARLIPGVKSLISLDSPGEQLKTFNKLTL